MSDATNYSKLNYLATMWDLSLDHFSTNYGHLPTSITPLLTILLLSNFQSNQFCIDSISLYYNSAAVNK